MLNVAAQSAHPPQMDIGQRPSGNRRPEPVKQPSALDVIDASIAPLEAEQDLLDLLRSLKEENDVRGMMNLYDFYRDVAALAQTYENIPRVTGLACDHMDFQHSQAWSKAYMVASLLKEIKPDEFDVERYGEILFNCTLQMGYSFAEAVAVVNEINGWKLHSAIRQRYLTKDVPRQSSDLANIIAEYENVVEDLLKSDDDEAQSLKLEGRLVELQDLAAKCQASSAEEAAFLVMLASAAADKAAHWTAKSHRDAAEHRLNCYLYAVLDFVKPGAGQLTNTRQWSMPEKMHPAEWDARK